jgi:hypothetical protein
MSEFDIHVCKRDGNWQVESTTMVDGTNRELRISTMRGHDGVVRTRASVHRIVDNTRRHTLGFGIEGDYSAPMMAMRYPRATEKTVRAQHDTCMVQAESVLYQVREHYAKQDAAANPAPTDVDAEAEVTA